jgi:hypothetical protein
MPIDSRSASVPGKRAGNLAPARKTQIKERTMNAIGSEKSTSADLDRFVSEQNIARYRLLLDPNTDEGQRRTILGLLRWEFAKLRETSGIPVTQQERRPR